MREKLRHVVLVGAVVWGILPLWGPMASLPDRKGNRLSFTSETTYFSISFSVSFYHL